MVKYEELCIFGDRLERENEDWFVYMGEIVVAHGKGELPLYMADEEIMQFIINGQKSMVIVISLKDRRNE